MTDYKKLVEALRYCGNFTEREGCDESCEYFNDMDCPNRIMSDAAAAIEALQAASPWHRVEEPPKESGKQYAVWASKGYAYCDKWLGDRWLISSVAPETVTHWMPIEPPKEDA